MLAESPYAPEFDPFFEAAGLPARSLGLHGRTYEGTFDGRTVRVDASPRKTTKYAGEVRYRQYQGHKIDFSIGVAPATRFIAAPAESANRFSHWVNRRYGLSAIPISGPELAHLEIWALERDWAKRFLAAADVRASLLRLMPPGPQTRLRAFSLRPPGDLGFGVKADIRTIRRTDLTGWMNDLLLLAQAADQAPAPQQPAEQGRIELALKNNPALAAVGILAALVGAVGGIGIIMVAALIIVAQAC